jgi:molybdopterin molybdotransferase
MIPVPNAQTLIKEHLRPMPAEPIPLWQACHRVLQEDIFATENMPAFDRSAMDGFAIQTDDFSESFKIVGEIKAGDYPELSLTKGQTVRIFTGAPIPKGDLRVIMQEHTRQISDQIRILKHESIPNIRYAGEDIRSGEIILKAGVQLNAGACALLASLGIMQVKVTKLPRIFHLTTGDEVIAPSQQPQPGQIRNSNAALIHALLCEQNLKLVTHRHAGDDPQNLLKTIREANLPEYDMILISGGSGPGDYDLSPILFHYLDSTLHFREVNVRPGKPLMFGTMQNQVVFGLPGNPLSHFVCFHLFVQYALDILLGKTPKKFHGAYLGEDMKEIHNSRETWWPAKLKLHDHSLSATPIKWKSSGDITCLATSNALIKIPACTDMLPARTKVCVIATGKLD